MTNDKTKIALLTGSSRGLGKNTTLALAKKNHRAFATDESAFNVVFLAMHNIAKRWRMPISNWKPALNRFAIVFEDRLPL